MLNSHTMTKEFESEKNKKALLYTVIICGTLLLLFIIIRWTVMPPSIPVVQDLMEINLGNNDEGFGEKQPLIKGERSPSREAVIQPRQSAPREAAAEKIDPDENAQEDAAPVTKPEKKTPKVKVETAPTPVVVQAPKPQKPKLTYNGPGKGTGNGATQDNSYRMQGNKPGGKGDAGDPNGNKDSYGNTPGGKIGGSPKVIGNRTIIKYYSFTDELPKAVINALVKVSPSGKGTFVGFGKGSTSTEQRYANSIIRHLVDISFNASTNESTVTVVFNFTQN
ncbi:hypothetical protein BH11BAC4_BH11BAC4_10920 [soil metagenome]